MYKKRRIPIGRDKGAHWELTNPDEPDKKVTVTKEQVEELPDETAMPEKILQENDIDLMVMGNLYEFPEAAYGEGYVFSYELYDRSTGATHATAVAFDHAMDFPKILRDLADGFDDAHNQHVTNQKEGDVN